MPKKTQNIKKKNKMVEILYTKQYSQKKIKPKKGRGSFRRNKK